MLGHFVFLDSLLLCLVLLGQLSVLPLNHISQVSAFELLAHLPFTGKKKSPCFEMLNENYTLTHM